MARSYSVVHTKYRCTLTRLAPNRPRQRQLWPPLGGLRAKAAHHGQKSGRHWVTIPGEDEGSLDELEVNAGPVNSRTRWYRASTLRAKPLQGGGNGRTRVYPNKTLRFAPKTRLIRVNLAFKRSMYHQIKNANDTDLNNAAATRLCPRAYRAHSPVTRPGRTRPPSGEVGICRNWNEGENA